jgi:hypothetical protein
MQFTLGRYGSQQHNVMLHEQSLKFDLAINGELALVNLSLPEIRGLASRIVEVLGAHYSVESVRIIGDGAGSITLRRQGCTANIAVNAEAIVLRRENGSILIAQEIDGHWYRGMIPAAITEPMVPSIARDAGFVARQLLHLNRDWA